MVPSKRQIAAKSRVRGSNGKFLKVENYTTPEGIKYSKIGNAIVPNAGGYSHVFNFAGIIRGPSDVYRNLDEATRDSQSNALAMRRDPVLLQPLFDREFKVACLPWHLECEDEKKDPECQRRIDKLTNIIQDIPRLTEMFRNCMEALWWGKMGIVMNYQFIWQSDPDDVVGLIPERQMVAVGWTPILGDKLVFGQDNTRLGYLTNLYSPEQQRSIPSFEGRAIMFDELEREAIILHKNFIIDGGFYEQQFSIGIHGVGYRSLVYWAWFNRQTLLGYLFDAMQRFGAGGIQIWTFEAGNPQSETAVRQAAQVQQGNTSILVPRPPGSEKSTTGLEIIGPDGIGLDAFLDIINDYYNNQLVKFISGENIGDKESKGSAEGEQNLTNRMMRFDAQNLEETLTNQLVKILQKHNFPGRQYAIKFKFAVDRPNPEKWGNAAQRAFEMGVELDAQQIRDVLGIAKPDKGAETIKKDMSIDQNQTMRKPIRNVGELANAL